jgi:Mor family transcriptional regulator
MAKTRCTHSFQPSDTDGARLLHILGARRLAALQAAFGGTRVWIAKPEANIRCVVCRQRDRCIRTWRERGLPVATIAKKLGVSPKTVYRVLRAKPA